METLPPPGDEAAAHGDRVATLVHELIEKQGGAIGFDVYMDAVLYAPGLGYYSAGATKLGADGDFTTAPETSSLFSRCLAHQWAQLHVSGISEVLELGAGSGRLAADFLVESAAQGVLPSRYCILEVSAELRQRQRETLEALVPTFIDRVMWLDELPEAFEGLMLANEVLDALPVTRFRRRTDGVEEMTVIADGGRFGWNTRAAPEPLVVAVEAIEQALGERLPASFVSEVNLRVAPWIAALAAALHRGAVLLVDYGMSRAEYYASDRNGGTLRCHYRHRAHDDPFVWPGLQDITAQVDFTAVAAAGVSAGLNLAGYTTQAHMLVGCGIETLMSEPVADERSLWIRAQQAQRLMLPGEMGERFKAIGFTRGIDVPLCAFSIRDFSDRL